MNAATMKIGDRVSLEGVAGTVTWVNAATNDCKVTFDDDGQGAYVDPSELVPA